MKKKFKSDFDEILKGLQLTKKESEMIKGANQVDLAPGGGAACESLNGGGCTQCWSSCTNCIVGACKDCTGCVCATEGGGII